MRLGRTLILVALLLVVVLGAVFVAMQFLGGGGGEPEATPTPVMVSVVALKRPVSAGDRLVLEDLQTIDIPEEEYNAEMMYIARDRVVGLYIKESPEFDENNPTILIFSMLTNNPQEMFANLYSEHAALIPNGMVAFPVPISRFSGVAYGVSQGDRINLIATVSFVDVDVQFQTALPNYMAAVISPGYAMLMTSNNEHLGVGMTSEEQSFFLGQSNFVEQGETLPWVNLVAQSISGDYLSVQGRAEQDTLLEEPLYLVPGENQQRPRVVSQTVLYNRTVLHVGTFEIPGQAELEAAIIAQQQAAAAAEAEAAGEEGQQQQPPPVPEVVPPDIVTLIVTPQEAVTLNYLLYTDVELTMALRPPGDDSVVPTDAVSLQYLLDVYRIPVPVRLPYGMQPPVYELEPPVLLNDEILQPTTP